MAAGGWDYIETKVVLMCCHYFSLYVLMMEWSAVVIIML